MAKYIVVVVIVFYAFGTWWTRDIPSQADLGRLKAREAIVTKKEMNREIRLVDPRIIEKTKILKVPYINQYKDQMPGFNGKWACSPTSCIMALAYYKKLTPRNEHKYSFYISQSFKQFTKKYSESDDTSGAGAWGYIWKDGNEGVIDNTISFLREFDLKVKFYENPSAEEAKGIITNTIAQGNVLIGRTAIFKSGHYVTIVGYKMCSKGIKYVVNDPAKSSFMELTFEQLKITDTGTIGGRGLLILKK